LQVAATPIKSTASLSVGFRLTEGCELIGFGNGKEVFAARYGLQDISRTA
jgi:hypothetical protein